MKKMILVILVLILATLCFASCDQMGQYSQLNQISKKSYTQVKIDITVQKSGEQSQLVSNIVCITNQTTKQITYILQEYAQIGVSGDTITMPEQQIVTKRGTVTVENGKVSNQEGDSTDLDFVNIGNIKFKFSDSCLFNAKTENGVFTAYVTNTAAFLGTNIQGATNVKVAVDTQTFQTITLTYTANGSDVTIVYTLK